MNIVECIMTWHDRLTIGMGVSASRVAARAARCMRGVAQCTDWGGSQDVNVLHHDHGYDHRSLASHPDRHPILIG